MAGKVRSGINSIQIQRWNRLNFPFHCWMLLLWTFFSLSSFVYITVYSHWFVIPRALANDSESGACLSETAINRFKSIDVHTIIFFALSTHHLICALNYVQIRINDNFNCICLSFSLPYHVWKALYYTNAQTIGSQFFCCCCSFFINNRDSREGEKNRERKISWNK